MRTSLTLALLAGLGAVAPAQSIAVDELLVESKSSGAYVVSASPRFSWLLTGSLRGATQSAFQIRIGLAWQWPGAIAFDSGKVTSSRQTLVELAGLALSPGRTYRAELRVWDQANTPTAFTPPIEFTVAPAASAWAASTPVWDGTATPNNYALFRDRFTVGAAPSKVTLYVTAKDAYRLYVDGEYQGSGPARSEPTEALLYNAFDLTDLGAGERRIAVEAHWLGSLPGGTASGLPCFRWMAFLEYADGSTGVAGSDPTSPNFLALRRTSRREPTPIRGPDYARASSVESFLAKRADRIGKWWTDPYDDSRWRAPSAQGVPVYPLRLQDVPIREEVTALPVASVRAETDGTYTVDVGEFTVGWPTIRLPATKRGDDLRIRYADRLDAAGRIVPDNGAELVTNLQDDYRAFGPGEVWSPHYYEAFQYLEIAGLRQAPLRKDITVTRVGVPMRGPAQPGFQSSDSLLDAIYAISERAQRSCTQDGIFMDSPQRERRQYFADGFIQAMNVAYTFEDPLVLSKMLRDARALDRLVPGLVPAAWPSDSPLLIAEWSLHYPLAVWKRWELYEDRRALAENYDAVARLQQSFEGFRSPVTGLLTGLPGLSDWPNAAIDSSCATRTPLNSFYYGVLRVLEAIAGELGRTADAVQYAALAANVRQAINTQLFDGVDRYADCLGAPAQSQISSAFALHFDVVPDAARPAVLAFVKSQGFQAETYGGYYLTDVLVREGCGQFLFDEMQDTTRLWANMVLSGATTTWEFWTPQGSWCHAFTAYPLKFLKQMAGLDPAAPGWSRVRVRPLLVNQLSFMSAAVPTPKGDASVRWERVGNALRVSTTIPTNVFGDVHVPRGVAGDLRLDGVPLVVGGAVVGSLPTGVVTVSVGATEFVVEVGGGSYLFESS